MNPQIDKVYALAVGPEDSPIYFYVGIALDTDKRWEEHKRAIENGEDMKKAYEWVRYDRRRHTLRMDVLDPDGTLTETQWKNFLLKEGHPLQNVGGTVDVKRKKRVKSPVQLAFEEVNKRHEQESLARLIQEARARRETTTAD